jgi:hypothetical protein
MTDNGNLRLEAEEIEEFAVGDCVRLKDKYLKDKDLRMMGPRKLLSIGWPNEFWVDRVGSDRSGQAISFNSCCCNLLDKKGGYLCRWHQAKYFERTKPEVMGEDRPKRKGDRTASVVTPLGDFASFEYLEDDENPGLVLNILGKKVKINVRKVLEVIQGKGSL